MNQVVNFGPVAHHVTMSGRLGTAAVTQICCGPSVFVIHEWIAGGVTGVRP